MNLKYPSSKPILILLFLSVIFLTLGLSISFQSILAAWTAPLANPAACLTGNPGCDAPISSGSPLMQQMQGSLWIVDSAYPTNPYGLIVEKGNVGIGAVNPGAKLEVSGQVRINSSVSDAWGGWNDAIKFTNPSHAAIFYPSGNLLFGLHSDRNFYWADTANGWYSMILQPSGNLIVRNNITVAGQNVCRQDGTNCPVASTNADTVDNLHADSFRQFDKWQGSHYSSSGGGEHAAVFYDTDNSGYYVDPHNVSRQNRINFTSLHGVNWAIAAPRWDFSSYVVESQHLYGHDSTQTMYLGESNPVIVRGDIRSPIFYDQNDTNYYLDPNGTSKINNITVAGQNVCRQDGTNCPASTGLKLDTLQGNHYSGSDGAEHATIFYDTNNTGYYVDPHSASVLNQAYIVDVRPQYMYDWNDSAYYIDMNGVSRMNYLGRNYGWNWTEYDWNDGNYYMDLNSVSILNDLRVNILYDKGNTGYYVDPNGTSVMNKAYITDVRPQYMYDWDDPTYYIDMNNTSNIKNLNADIMYDRNDTSYYVDPGATSKFATLHADIMYDRNDTSAYINPAGTSYIKYLNVDKIYDRNNINYYVNPAETSKIKYLQTDKMYDNDDTNYYIDPTSASKMKQINIKIHTNTNCSWISESSGYSPGCPDGKVMMGVYNVCGEGGCSGGTGAYCCDITLGP